MKTRAGDPIEGNRLREKAPEIKTIARRSIGAENR